MKESEKIVTSASFTRTPERRCAVPFSKRGRQRGGGFAAPKGSQPRLAALGSPFQGKGLAWTLPPSYGRRCPEGAEVGLGKRDEKDRGEIVSSVSFTRAPYPPLRGAPSPMGKATIRECRFSRIVRVNTRICGKKNNDGQSLPLEGKVPRRGG